MIAHKMAYTCIVGDFVVAVAVVVMKAILEAMQGVVTNDVESVIKSLNAMTQSLRTVMKTMRRLKGTSACRNVLASN